MSYPFVCLDTENGVGIRTRLGFELGTGHGNNA